MLPQLIASNNSAATTTSPTADQGHRRTYGGHLLFWGICAVLAVLGFFTTNGLVTSAAFVVPPILVQLLWRKGEPPVLLFGCMIQWLQATAAIFYTNHYRVTLEDAFGSNELAVATWLSIIAVVVLALGIRCGFIGAGPSLQSQIEAGASQVDIKKLAILYVVFAPVAAALSYTAWLFTSITQLLLGIASLKWGIIFLLCYCVLHQQRNYGLLGGCLIFEFVTGFFGIFANFKSVFFVLVVAATASPLALRGRRLAATVMCFGIIFISGVVWTAIKMDYREFLANQETANEEAIPIERKFEKLTDLVSSVTWENFTDGMDALIMRVSYVNYFALAVENVPNRVPYENGELWKGSIMHVLTPRLLFPDKPVLDDSERTRLYTGIQVSGIESGTSIGIGYIGESYIDFGPVWMFAPIFLLGVLYGLINRFFLTRTRYKLLGAALAVSVLIFNAYEIEVSNIKLVGGVVSVALVSIVIYMVCGRTIANFLRQSPMREPRIRQFPPGSRVA
jgi:hypothetical protein